MKKRLTLFFLVGTLILLTVETVSADTNIGLIPDNFGGYLMTGRCDYPSGGGAPQITFYDNTTGHGGHYSVRIDGHTGADPNTGRECDWSGSTWEQNIAVVPGDRVYFSVWVKTQPNNTNLYYGSGSTWHGAYIGFDLYSYDFHRLWEFGDGTTTDFHTTGFAYCENYHHVDYGSDWTLLTMDVIIPDQWFTHDDYGNSVGGLYQTAYIEPWISMRWIDTSETASGWFSDSTLYINPTEQPTPAPTATPTATPTPATTPNYPPYYIIQPSPGTTTNTNLLGSLGTAFLLVLLMGISFVVFQYMYINRKNFMEIILTMFILGTAGYMAIVYLVSCF